MATTKKRALGDVGEGVACKYYEKQGYVVVERNYLKPWGEIDIVIRRGDELRFVEVKTVSCEPKGSVTREPLRPEENMHEHKVRRLHRAIQTYLLDRKIPESQAWQLDLACVYLDFSTRRARVEVLENIVL